MRSPVEAREKIQTEWTECSKWVGKGVPAYGRCDPKKFPSWLLRTSGGNGLEMGLLGQNGEGFRGDSLD